MWKRLERQSAPWIGTKGPDGFTMTFVQECWDVVKDDLLADFY